VKCPRCGAPSEVRETRQQSAAVSRRRECFNAHRFTTFEVPPVAVDKRQLAAAARGIVARARAWTRRLQVLRSKEPASTLARRLGITEARVRQIRSTEG
jgi:hypothetical protein